MLASATIFTAPQLVAVAGTTVAAVFLARRRWDVAVAATVVAAAFGWSWMPWLKHVGNIAYWGLVLGIAVALVNFARTSRLARVLVGLCVGIGVLLALTRLWSIVPHTTLVETGKFGAVLVVASFVAVHSRADGDRALVRALAVVGPAFILVSVLGLIRWKAAQAAGGGTSGFLAGPNALSILLAMLLPFALVHPLAASTWRKVAVVWVFTFVIALSAGRSGILSAAVVVAVLSIYRRSTRQLVTGLAAIVAATALVAAWGPDIPTLGAPMPQTPNTPQTQQLLLGSRPADQSRLSAFLGARDEAWREAVRLLPKRLYQGTGFGSGFAIFAHYHSRPRFHYFIGAFENDADLHDAYLQDVLELGIFGGLVFLAPALLALFRVVQMVVRGAPSSFDPAGGALVASAAFAALFESLFSELGPMTLLSWIGFALVLASWRLPAAGRDAAGDHAVLGARD